MIEYTKEEYEKLWGMSPRGIFASMVRQYVDDKPLTVKVYDRPNGLWRIKTFGTIQETIKAITTDITYGILYKLPLDEIPLQMDTQDPLIMCILKWRLIIGK